MNKNIKTEVVVGIILIITVIIGGFVWLESKQQNEILSSDLRISNDFNKACTQEAKICSDGTSVSRTGPNCEFAPCPNIENEEAVVMNSQKIVSFKRTGRKEFGMNEYEIEISNFKDPLWLCIQEDYYSKPNNKECNDGTSVQQFNSRFFANIENHALLVLYSDSGQKILYDEVYISMDDDKNFQISYSSELCGTLIHNEDGSYFIKNQRLLTVPGWKDLIPYINEDVCVRGVKYQQSFRVYFIEGKK